MTAADDVLAAPLSVLGLNIRATNALLNNGFSTVGDVVAKTEIEILQQPNLGPVTLTNIKEKLSALGLALLPSPPPPK
jgi:DNA-directed RNA polymerase subunit alpha